MTIHIDGFEQFFGEHDMSAAFTRAGYDPGGPWVTVAGRGGPDNYAITGNNAVLTRAGEWTGNKFSVGFCHQFNSRASIAWLLIGQTRVVLWLNRYNGAPTLNDSAGNSIPTMNRWYYYELEIDRASGRVYLYINNRLDVSYDIGYVPNDSQVIVNLGYLEPKFYPTDLPYDLSAKTYDDLYINDGPRLGPISVTTRFPMFDKHVEWFAASAGSTHSDSLSKLPPEPLDHYVASDQIGAEDRFTNTKPLNNNNAILATGIVVMARRSPQFIAQIGVFIGGQEGADLRQDVRIVPSDWATQYVCFERNINDTVAGIKAADFGITVQPIT
jgi:hypothetical protein